ncbi:MAG: YfhO family protein [Candidatus Curtissbacteria bacterium]|nr:YfhO family protein [Candidatus Curtissbacteria bacterium]
MPSDSLLGLYHPWRDNSFEGFMPGKFPTKNPLITDPILQTYPWKLQSVESFKNKLAPLWNPYSFAGQPLLSNVQSAPFQIFNITFFALPFNVAWGVNIILPLLATGGFMFFLLKNLGLSSAASAFGAFILPFTGFYVAWMTWGTVTTTAVWLPLILLCISKITKKISAGFFLLLTIAVSQTILSGHPQTAFYSLVASALFLIFTQVQKKNFPSAAIITFAIILGCLISSVQVLPAIEFSNLSARNTDQGYYQGREDWFIPPKHLIQLLAPDYFGNPATYNYWGVWNYAEFVSFIGIMPLSFALLAMASKKNHDKKYFFITLVAISLLFGLQNPISKIIYQQNIPFISSFQPSRIIFLLVFALSALTAFGLDYFLKGKPKKILLVSPLSIFLVLLTVFAFTYLNPEIFPKAGNIDAYRVAIRNLILPLATVLVVMAIFTLRIYKFSSYFLIAAIFTVSAFELFRFADKFTPYSKTSWIFPETATTSFLKAQEKPFRVMTTDSRIMPPNTSSVYRIESINGYDPLYLADYAKFITVLESHNPHQEAGSFNRIITPQNYKSPLVNLLNVKYILSFSEIKNENFEKVFEEGETKVFKNNGSMPRAFFVDEVIKANSKEDEYSKLLDNNFDFSKTATSREMSLPENGGDKSLSIESYRDQFVSLKTKTSQDSALVLTNVYYPGWKVYIDEKETKIYPADSIFQMVLVARGEHAIHFKYQPKTFYNGLALTAGGTFITIVMFSLLWLKKYR